MQSLRRFVRGPLPSRGFRFPKAGLTVSLPQAPRKDPAWVLGAGHAATRENAEAEIMGSQAEVVAAAAVAAHNPFPGGEVRYQPPA